MLTSDEFRIKKENVDPGLYNHRTSKRIGKLKFNILLRIFLITVGAFVINLMKSQVAEEVFKGSKSEVKCFISYLPSARIPPE